MYKFEWDKSKNTKNKEKHNISFEEAIDAFYDYDSLILYDEKHSGDEDRFYQIGMIRTLKVIIVVFDFVDSLFQYVLEVLITSHIAHFLKWEVITVINILI